MKKVFFVDDEILVREGIRNTINWRGEGFIYCGDAPDGESALPLIEELVPDIVITDIKMPFMDGLELSKIMKQRMPSIKIIILSGHDEFDYAREALRIGVTEYCVKPVDSKDLIQLLHQVGNQIDIESQKRDELEYLKRKMDESVTFTKEKLLSDLCFGLVSAAAVIQASAAVNLKLLSRYYMVVITDYESSESANSLYTSEILHFKRNKREAVWIFRGEHPQELTEMAEQFIESVKWVADEEGPDTLIVGIGSIQDRMLGISQSYREAEEDKNFQYISKKYYNTSFRNNEVEMEHIIFLDRQKMLDFLKYGHYSETEKFTLDYAASIKEMDWSNPFYIYFLLMDTTVTLIQYVKENYKEHEQVINEIHALQKKMSQVKGNEDAFLFIRNIMEVYLKFREGFTDKYGGLIQKVKDYIHEHYHSMDLSLQQVAQNVNVSQGHLSTVFSNETGHTFIEYVTNTRIKKAMELLKTTSVKSYEIAYLVGYNDAHYFSNLFKKVTGMTTTNYRKHGASQINLIKEGE